MKQPYPLSIALRYLRARSKNSFISFISLVSMIGIGLGVAVLIVVLSVMNGFEHELQQRILGMASDATISGIDEPLEDWRAVRERALARPDVLAAAPFVEGQGLAWRDAPAAGVADGRTGAAAERASAAADGAGAAGVATAGVMVRGVDPALEGGVSRVGEMLRVGHLDELRPGAYNVLIGVRLADTLDVGVGDRMVLAIPRVRMTPAGPLPRYRVFTVAGIFDAGMYEYDRGLVFANLEDAALLYATGGRATGVRLAVEDIYLAGRVVSDLARDLAGARGFMVSDWTRQHVNFFRSIALTKTIMFVILSLIIGVAAFNIVSTLVMVVRDKRADIAILRSFGATPRAIMAVFASQGTLIGVIGTAFGLALGVLVTSQLENIVQLLETWLNVELFTGEVYFISDLPTQMRFAEIGQICLLAALLAVAATIYPALRAARQAPAEALRYE